MYVIDEEGRRIPAVQYGETGDAAVYYRICPKCGKYVKADMKSAMPANLVANATARYTGEQQCRFVAGQTNWNETRDNLYGKQDKNTKNKICGYQE